MKPPERDDRPTVCADRGSLDRVKLAVAFLLIAGGMLVYLARLDHVDDGVVSWATWLPLGGATLLVAAAIAFRKPQEPRPSTIRPRAGDHAGVNLMAGSAHPYRARFTRAVSVAAPPVSGKVLTIALLACMAFAAALVPVSLGLPRWVEWQIVLAFWWALSAATLMFLLYRGHRVADDHSYTGPTREPEVSRDPATGLSTQASFVGQGCMHAGCAGEFFIFAFVAVALGASWLLVEVALPAIFLLAYYLVMSAIGRVANASYGCQGRLGRSALWGLIWSSLYFAPLALLVVGVQLILGR